MVILSQWKKNINTVMFVDTRGKQIISPEIGGKTTMPTQIKNNAELKNTLEALAGKAIEEAAEEILKIFQDKYIWGMAYIDNPKQYERTGELSEAFHFSELKRESMRLSMELFYDVTKMKTFDMDRFIHGSKYSSPTDIRNNLPVILEGKQSSLWLSVSREGKFWQEFIKEAFQGGMLDKILMKHLTANGFVKV